jgi:hypothetical protein
MKRHRPRRSTADGDAIALRRTTIPSRQAPPRSVTAPLTVSSWNEAIEALYADSWSASLNRFRSPLCFRGVNRLEASLEHGLQRGYSNPGVVERHLLRSFRRYVTAADAPHRDVPWHWLALAQHHGLPTRLLDWSYSPFVALHYATHDAALHDHDGGVWCADYSAARRSLPAALRHALHGEGGAVFTPELLDAAVASLDQLARVSRQPALVFLEPPSIDHRIVNQYALFSFLSRADASHSEWFARHPRAGRLVVIDRRAKLEIRDKLDQANITERLFYPGLDGLCRWLRRYYEPRAAARRS